ncbi:MAG: hypothetical protein U9O64_08515 [Campylobacterota bacterium]|nr:hypothetical protein [Campylobacterota bacterium]
MFFRGYTFRFLIIGLLFLFSFSLTLNASVSLNDYPQIKSIWDEGDLSSAITQLQKEVEKNSNNDQIVELLKKITFQKTKLDQWIGRATLLLKQKKFEEAKETLSFVSMISPNYSFYRNLINKIKNAEDESKYPSKMIFDGKSLNDSWKSYQANGGNFVEHSQFKNNKFTVDVPKGSGWGKVGISSIKPIINFIETNQTVSHHLKFNFDVNKTTGFVIYLKGINPDTASYSNITIWYKHLDDKKAILELHKDGSLNMQLEMSIVTPASLNLVIQPNNFVYLYLPDGRYLQTTSLKYPTPEKGYKLEILSHSEKNDLPAKMALKSISLQKLPFQKRSHNVKAGEEIVLFDGKFLDAKWLTYGAYGGNFIQHVELKDHKLIVNVSKDNKWGTTGIRSSDPIIWLDDFGEGAEVKMTFNFDSKLTDGFAISLAGGISQQSPANPRAIFYWNQISESNQSVMKLLLDDKEVWKEELNSSVSPEHITFKLEPGEITLSGDSIPTKSKEWYKIKANAGFRVWAYSHAYKENQAVKMALRKITVKRKVGESISRVRVEGVPLLPVKEFFTGKDDKKWETIGTAGGNFKKFGHFKNGKMVVDVPKKNYWGKTGILSKKDFLKFNQRLRYIPYKMTIKVDPSETTGFVIAFSGSKKADMWLDHRLWIGVRKSKNSDYYFYLHGSASWGRKIDAEMMNDWDGTLEIVFENKWTKVCLNGVCIAGSIGQIPFTSTFATIVSHPANEHGASKLTLEKITGQWIAPDGMRAIDRWQFVDDEDFDPKEFLRELKEELEL